MPFSCTRSTAIVIALVLALCVSAMAQSKVQWQDVGQKTSRNGGTISCKVSLKEIEDAYRTRENDMQNFRYTSAEHARARGATDEQLKALDDSWIKKLNDLEEKHQVQVKALGCK